MNYFSQFQPFSEKIVFCFFGTVPTLFATSVYLYVVTGDAAFNCIIFLKKSNLPPECQWRWTNRINKYTLNE